MALWIAIVFLVLVGLQIDSESVGRDIEGVKRDLEILGMIDKRSGSMVSVMEAVVENQKAILELQGGTK
ncbi:MAG: hypothetical protein NUV65_03575 [Candidatus Roizmanbacteria bacterium]|nr:hypothetical protein [Candidatus Roizmanbacteria bacterium]